MVDNKPSFHTVGILTQIAPFHLCTFSPAQIQPGTVGFTNLSMGKTDEKPSGRFLLPFVISPHLLTILFQNGMLSLSPPFHFIC